MPNWCNNKLTISGPDEQLAEFVAQANGPDQNYGPQEFEVKHRAKKDGISEDQARVLLEQEEAEKNHDPNPLSFHQIVPIPDEVLKQNYSDVGYHKEGELWGVIRSCT